MGERTNCGRVKRRSALWRGGLTVLRARPAAVASGASNGTILVTAMTPVDAFTSMMSITRTDYRHLWHMSLANGLLSSMVRRGEGLTNAVQTRVAAGSSLEMRFLRFRADYPFLAMTSQVCGNDITSGFMDRKKFQPRVARLSQHDSAFAGTGARRSLYDDASNAAPRLGRKRRSSGGIHSEGGGCVAGIDPSLETATAARLRSPASGFNCRMDYPELESVEGP